MNRIEPKELETWIAQLNEPLEGPGGGAEPTEAELEKDAAAFMAAMGG